eukprot:527029_1
MKRKSLSRPLYTLIVMLFTMTLTFMGYSGFSIYYADHTMERCEVMHPVGHGSPSIKTGQYSCANCGKYTKTSKCTRVHQLETAKELTNVDLEKCNKYSR